LKDNIIIYFFVKKNINLHVYIKKLVITTTK